MARWLNVVTLVILSCCASVSYKLNVPKILLPYYVTRATNFTLQINDPSGGCFEWHSSRPEVASVSSVDGKTECADTAIVSAVSKVGRKLTSVVFAREKITGAVLQCDVIVDKIHSTEIVTTTRELFLEDAPEEFLVRAKNDQGDTFSNLGGIGFEWSLLTDTEMDSENVVDAHDIIRIIQYSDSHYDAKPDIESLERLGKHGYSILVEGVLTGSAFVSVKLLEEPYLEMPSVNISLLVIAHLMLNPSFDVYVPVDSIIHYRVELLKQGKAEDIKMPSQQYYLEVQDQGICSLNIALSNIKALQIGSSEVILKDKNIKTRRTFRESKAAIHVVQPSFLQFVVLPGRNWLLESGQHYAISVEIFDQQSKKIYITENLRVEAALPSKYFDVLHGSTNGTHFHVIALEPGKDVLNATFFAMIGDDGREIKLKHLVKGSQEFEVVDPITVTPPLVVFPYHVEKKSTHQFPLNAIGGSGNYSWTSNQPSICQVSEFDGILTASTLNQGQSTIVASDMKNRLHKASAEVHVLPPSRVKFLPSKSEALIGDSLHLKLAVYTVVVPSTGKGDKKEVAVVDCHSLPFEFGFLEKKSIFEFVEILEVDDRLGDECAIVVVRAKSAGNSEIKASLTAGASKLTDRMTVTHPGHDVLLAIGSSFRLKFAGGPAPWVLDPSQYFAQVWADNKKLVSVPKNVKIHSGLLSARVTCSDIGQTTIWLKVGSSKVSSNQFPAVGTLEFVVSCDVPSRVSIFPKLSEPLKNIPACPLAGATGSDAHVYFAEEVDLVIVSYDDKGRRFDNVSSLVFDCDISDQTLLSDNSKDGTLKLLRRSDHEDLYGEFYFPLMPQKKIGVVTVTFSVNSYIDSLCGRGDVCKKSLKKIIPKASLDLQLTDLATLNPASLTVFNHPKNKVSISILHGSGYFYIESTSTGSKLAKFDLSGSNIEMTPMVPGSMALGVRDLCIHPSQLMQCNVRISNIISVDIAGPHKVESGKKINLDVRMIDDSGTPLSASSFSLMNLDPIIDDTTLLTVKADQLKSDMSTLLTTGLQPGTTSVRVSAMQADGQLLTSHAHSIQVYSPFRLSPHNITVLPGTFVQINAIGGPQPLTGLEYSLNQSDIVSVKESGLIEALQLGHVRVTGRIYDVINGQRMVICEDHVFIHVVLLRGVRINVPTTTVTVGSKIPVHVTGLGDDVTPISFGSMQLPILFDWSSDNPSIGSLESVYEMPNLHDDSVGTVAKRLVTKLVGRITIGLSARTRGDYQIFTHGAGHSDSVLINVIDDFSMASTCSGRILVTPDTKFSLATSRDCSSCQVNILPRPSSSSSSAQKPTDILMSSKTTDSTNSQPHLRSGKSTGDAVVYVTAPNKISGTDSKDYLVFGVEVNTATYMMLNAQADFRLKPGVSVLPVGHQLTFKVTFHDSLGYEFLAANNRLNIQFNRNDLVEVRKTESHNQTISIRLKKPGLTILRITDSYTSTLSDYVHIKVGAVLTAGKSIIRTGDLLCFNSFLIGDHLQWSSDQPSLFIDQSTGIAFAKSTGSGVVSARTSEGVTSLPVSIKDIENLSISANGIKFIRANTNKHFKFSVSTVSDFEQQSSTSTCPPQLPDSIVEAIRHNVPFTCAVDWNRASDSVEIVAKNVFLISAVFNELTGNYYCVLKVLPQTVAVLETLAEMRDLHTVVKVITESGLTKQLSLPFYSDFVVDSSVISLNDLHKTQAVLAVIASKETWINTKVSSTSSDIINVGSSVTEVVGHKYEITVSLNRYSQALWMDDVALNNLAVIIKNKVTNQEVTVPVSVAKLGRAPAGYKVPALGLLSGIREYVISIFWWICQHPFVAFVTIVLMIIAIIIAIRLLEQQKIMMYEGNMPLNASLHATPGVYANVASPGSTMWRSHGSSGGGSPHTPYLYTQNAMQNVASPPAYSNRSPGSPYRQ